MAWNPEQYLKFADHRLRPGLELLARIPDGNYKKIVDLGCGAGNLGAFLQKRWPAALVVGVDNSPEMLETASANMPGASMLLADIRDWKDSEVDVIFANASLHWLDNHRAVFERLLAMLNPGGVLAVQMPKNFRAPSHLLLKEVAEAGPWREELRGIWREDPVMEPEFYYRALMAADIWETEYLQALEGDDAVLEWVKGTALRPFLAALKDAAPFMAAYRAALAKAYPQENDGRTLFRFRRIFIVKRK